MKSIGGKDSQASPALRLLSTSSQPEVNITYSVLTTRDARGWVKIGTGETYGHCGSLILETSRHCPISPPVPGY